MRAEKSRPECTDQLYDYLNSVETGDKSNREGLAARCYFTALFGRGFVRHAPDSTNAALNYGYALILSTVSRALVLHGYSTALGIHHISRVNRFNLSCDLMEPFRPFVDLQVYRQGERSFDKLFKRELIASLQKRVLYGGRHCILEDAVSDFSLRTCRLMTDCRGELPEVRFD